MMRKLSILICFFAATCRADLFSMTNDLQAVRTTGLSGQVGPQAFEITLRSGTNAVNVAGSSSTLMLNYALTRTQIIIQGFLTSSNSIRFESIIEWPGNYWATGTLVSASGGRYIIARNALTLTNAASAGGGGSTTVNINQTNSNQTIVNITNINQTTVVQGGVTAIGSATGLVTIGVQDGLTLITNGNGLVLGNSLSAQNYGPNNIYNFSNSAVMYALAFGTTAVNQIWYAPTSGTYAVKAWGGGGGGSSGSAGSAGGYSFRARYIAQGQPCLVRVGQGGRINSAVRSLPGGGLGNNGVASASAGNGGGYSLFAIGTNDILTQADLSNVVVIAGGAAGMGQGSAAASAGAGGGATGGSASSGGATGGTQSTNGVNGSGSTNLAGSFLGTAANGVANGGGGGGGLFPGGGGPTNLAGGGGSGYAGNDGITLQGNQTSDADWSAGVGTAGAVGGNGGDGRIVIRWQP